MSKSDKGDEPQSFSDVVGSTFGKVYIMSMYQARATITLANAIEKDPSTSPELKSAATESLQMIDKIIALLEESLEDESTTNLVRTFIGRGEDEQR
ncbi:hypothetical protein OP492_04315 [Pseudomonas mosselii]|uniref:hypothetical protein n=1 Tax=Pseudomonas mosselii TaxID=78327 RepID=UPI002B0599BC|nr:hypothetical protein [Pseudomonas mosselii]MEA3233874.1 hypothetical protein [Pseudomonas mosselii]